ncbi:hypothetical protein M9H77_30417 [Catharanthus roseus]|uniref:Uncharacterized protein n=1 Tax=Catharanthus roseus TaxID=4058 RepID=A0ACB9ZX61_CATRO|nr:hypothetical protein M9H77_30417 [Catharanthus roseus]
MGFVAVVEAATRTEIADQAVIQRKTAIGLAATPYKHPGQGPWRPKDFKRYRSEQRTGNECRPTLTPGGAHRVCTYCGRSGHVAEMCYQKSRLCYRCGKPCMLETSALRCNRYLRRCPEEQADPRL